MDSDQNLGGRLALLEPSELSPEQQELHDRLGATRVAAAGQSGYRAALDDGRLIGPFNALLRIPDVGRRQLEWAQAIAAQGLPGTVRETVILTVAAEWDARYIAYAHAIAGRAAGLADSAIIELLAGGTPARLGREELLAHRLTRALVRGHDVPDELYSEAMAAFGEVMTVAITALVGQYLATSALLTCFRVPAPSEPAISASAKGQ